MKSHLTKLVASGVLTLSTAVSAFAGSVTQPGETMGLAAGAPLPQGVYFIDTLDWGVRSTSPNSTAVGVNIPVLAWSTPWTLLGARVHFLAAAPSAEVGVKNTDYVEGMYNPFFAGMLAWNLGNGLGFSYMLGGYAGVKTPVGFDTSSLNQRFALSYTANDWNLTANLIWGIQSQAVTTTENPDFVNIDLTATRKFGKWELGAVGYYSTDVSSPVANYARQSQFALGALVGYNFGPVILQAALTTDVAQQNYGGYDTRGWGRLIIPLGDPLAASAPASSGPMYRK